MKSSNVRRRSGGFVSAAALAALLAIGSGFLSLIDLRVAAKREANRVRADQERDDRISHLAADLAALKGQPGPDFFKLDWKKLVADARRAAQTKGGSPEREVVVPFRPFERGETPGSLLIKVRVEEEVNREERPADK